ncbi:MULTISPECIES: hypothetical protein [unclassified Microbacterium]|uniref:hypothetical protein n=1 Tax=unclassified Microbacterium TaxID=2609290 RepID=UPI003017B9BC
MQYAFVDESEPLGTGNGGPYVMVATLPLCDDESDLDELRHSLRQLKLHGAKKLHWYDSVEPLRDQIVDTICRMPLLHWAVVIQPCEGDRPERTRRACMERLLWELGRLEVVARVVFESRGAASDRRDMKLVHALRAKRVITARMRVDHVRGATEPLLWVPDAVCGAVNGRLMKRDVWAGRLDHQLWIVT